MRTEKKQAATKRNWSKFMLCGARGQLMHIKESNDGVLSELEKEEITEIEDQLEELINHWDIGTEKVLEEE